MQVLIQRYVTTPRLLYMAHITGLSLPGRRSGHWSVELHLTRLLIRRVKESIYMCCPQQITRVVPSQPAIRLALLYCPGFVHGQAMIQWWSSISLFNSMQKEELTTSGCQLAD